MNTFFNQSYNWKNLSILVLSAFFLRAIVFFTYIQYNERYRQADSMDYHACTLSLTVGKGMFHIQKNTPIFWRTPGYPLYLTPFYKAHGLTNAMFSTYSSAQKASIWIQIILCSFIPILVFFLALMLTNSLTIAWISSWIFVFHLGFVLASCYLLTEGLAIIFFYLFLLFFYLSFTPLGQKEKQNSHTFLYVVLSALSLILYTWMRPNGQFIALIALMIFLFCACSWKNKAIKIVLFSLVFFVSLSPWYIRNHNLTGQWFFCPMSGPYHLTFTVPKIVRRITGQKLELCIKSLFSQIRPIITQTEKTLRLTHPEYYVSQELICKQIAQPWLLKYPHYLMIDWMREVCKTTFDLYSSQLVAFSNNSFTYDPTEEFLIEKLKNCIYKQPMSLFMRIICLIELLFSLLLWFGLVGGFVIFIIQPLYYFVRNKRPLSSTTYLWLKTGVMIGGLLVMTGGFGYARLRMPAEVLMIILSLTFWFWFLTAQKEKRIV